MATLNIAVPVALVNDANQLARCTGYGPSDGLTFSFPPNMRDAEGNLYVFASGWVSDSYPEALMYELSEPAWGCDMDAARRAKGAVVLGGKAGPQVIAAVLMESMEGALEVLGLVPRMETQEGDLSGAGGGT